MKLLTIIPGLLLILFCTCAAAQTINYNIDTAFHQVVNCNDVNATFFELKAKYPERSDHLVMRADSALQGIPLLMNGNITFQLIIGCDGVPAKISLQQTDMKYQSIQFSKEAVERLYSFVKSLKEWKKANVTGKPIYYRSYLSFKIRYGHVAEVSP